MYGNMSNARVYRTQYIVVTSRNTLQLVAKRMNSMRIS